ncbi:hypothetical protein [Spirosoma pollinicola]|uniref:Uncharacterized protein n=1 Tax=Spirosoma pollinicola TaxID=2057025 RepID=A0A2K8Z0M9_9BACT|nr:hypothetical protein [Spirosoma pollinicola]AUD03446.1 hypothetical protein CWM47_17360 [Spirosoma pollinicola]
MVRSWEVSFGELCPAIDQIVERVNQQMDGPTMYLADKWLLVGKSQVLNLYQDGAHKIIITGREDTTNFVQVILTTLEAMGGILSLD